MLRYKSFSISSFMFPFSTDWACLAVRNRGLKRLFDRNILGIDCSKRFSHRPERAKHVSFIFLTTFTKVLSISWFSPGFANSPDLLLIFSPSFKKISGGENCLNFTYITAGKFTRSSLIFQISLGHQVSNFHQMSKNSLDFLQVYVFNFTAKWFKLSHITTSENMSFGEITE